MPMLWVRSAGPTNSTSTSSSAAIASASATIPADSICTTPAIRSLTTRATSPCLNEPSPPPRVRSATPRWPLGGYRRYETASRTSSIDLSWGSMMPSAPRSSARPTRSRSADCERTTAAIGVVAAAYRSARRSDSVAAPCSRSSTAQSNPARPQSSTAIGEARSENTPISVSPSRILVRRSAIA